MNTLYPIGALIQIHTIKHKIPNKTAKVNRRRANKVIQFFMTLQIILYIILCKYSSDVYIIFIKSTYNIRIFIIDSLNVLKSDIYIANIN